MAKFLRLSYLCMVASLCSNFAFPSYRNHVPNGFRVSCPPGGEGCSEGGDGQPALVCNGIGHRTCAGATMPLNSFGAALKRNNYTWDKALCEEDSDGDGLTNGEELGDPCCLWEAYDEPSTYTASYSATHPGFSNSNVTAYDRPADCRITAPKLKATKMNVFNEWEEKRTAEVFIDNFSIPSKRTTYVDFAWNFPDDSADLFHVVFAEAIIRNAKNLHHYVVRGCSKKWPADKVGKQITRQDMGACGDTWGGWAPGNTIASTPPWLGKPIGKSVGVVAFAVQVHYDNPMTEEGRISNDGMRIFYTPTLRNETEKVFPITTISLNPIMGIPAGKARFFMTRSCQVEVKDKQGQPAKYHVAGVGYHAHLLGREMYLELTRGNNNVDLGSARIWHFDDQYIKNLLLMNITLQTGDHLQSTCIFNSMARSHTTVIGMETIDEMCWASLRGWPGDVEVGCRGHVWTGELAESESGLGLVMHHPESAAADVWDGSDLSTGGKLVKGGLTDVCYDAPAIQSMCSTLVKRAASLGEAACFSDLGSFVPRMQGRTLPSICCSEVCTQLCSTTQICKGKNGSASTSSSAPPSASPSPTPSPSPSPFVSNPAPSVATTSTSSEVSGSNRAMLESMAMCILMASSIAIL